jgi:hypothetical protein
VTLTHGDGVMGTRPRHVGQHGARRPRTRGAVAITCSKHALSSECPHGSVTGSSSTSMHTTQQ